MDGGQGVQVEFLVAARKGWPNVCSVGPCPLFSGQRDILMCGTEATGKPVPAKRLRTL